MDGQCPRHIVAKHETHVFVDGKHGNGIQFRHYVICHTQLVVMREGMEIILFNIILLEMLYGHH